MQNFVSIEDPMAPGIFSTFTCEAEYRRNEGADVFVRNFYGNRSWEPGINQDKAESLNSADLI